MAAAAKQSKAASGAANKKAGQESDREQRVRWCEQGGSWLSGKLVLDLAVKNPWMRTAMCQDVHRLQDRIFFQDAKSKDATAMATATATAATAAAQCKTVPDAEKLPPRFLQSAYQPLSTIPASFAATIPANEKSLVCNPLTDLDILSTIIHIVHDGKTPWSRVLEVVAQFSPSSHFDIYALNQSWNSTAEALYLRNDAHHYSLQYMPKAFVFILNLPGNARTQEVFEFKTLRFPAEDLKKGVLPCAIKLFCESPVDDYFIRSKLLLPKMQMSDILGLIQRVWDFDSDELWWKLDSRTVPSILGIISSVFDFLAEEEYSLAFENFGRIVAEVRSHVPLLACRVHLNLVENENAGPSLESRVEKLWAVCLSLLQAAETLGDSYWTLFDGFAQELLGMNPPVDSAQAELELEYIRTMHGVFQCFIQSKDILALAKSEAFKHFVAHALAKTQVKDDQGAHVVELAFSYIFSMFIKLDRPEQEVSLFRKIYDALCVAYEEHAATKKLYGVIGQTKVFDHSNNYNRMCQPPESFCRCVEMIAAEFDNAGDFIQVFHMINNVPHLVFFSKSKEWLQHLVYFAYQSGLRSDEKKHFVEFRPRGNLLPGEITKAIGALNKGEIERLASDGENWPRMIYYLLAMGWKHELEPLAFTENLTKALDYAMNKSKLVTKVELAIVLTIFASSNTLAAKVKQSVDDLVGKNLGLTFSRLAFEFLLVCQRDTLTAFQLDQSIDKLKSMQRGVARLEQTSDLEKRRVQCFDVMIHIQLAHLERQPVSDELIAQLALSVPDPISSFGSGNDVEKHFDFIYQVMYRLVLLRLGGERCSLLVEYLICLGDVMPTQRSRRWRALVYPWVLVALEVGDSSNLPLAARKATSMLKEFLGMSSEASKLRAQVWEETMFWHYASTKNVFTADVMDDCFGGKRLPERIEELRAQLAVRSKNFGIPPPAAAAAPSFDDVKAADSFAALRMDEPD